MFLLVSELCRGAFFALKTQHAGVEKYEEQIRKYEQIIHNDKWKSQSNYPLEKHVAKHRLAYVQMETASQHVTYQLPNEHSRVGYLLESMITSDSGLSAAMASINQDKGEDGMRNNFETAVSHLIPYDPVAKNREKTRSGRGGAEIGSMEYDANISAFGAKVGIGKTGVHLRYYQDPEFKALAQDQIDELKAWRLTPEGIKATAESKKRSGYNKGKSGKATKKARFNENNYKKQVSSMSAKLAKTKAGYDKILALAKSKGVDDASISAIEAEISSTTAQPPREEPTTGWGKKQVGWGGVEQNWNGDKKGWGWNGNNKGWAIEVHVVVPGNERLSENQEVGSHESRSGQEGNG